MSEEEITWSGAEANLEYMHARFNLWHRGRRKKAEELLDAHVMKTSQKVLDAEHPPTLTSINNLTFTWEGQGQAAEAISLMDRCVQLRK